MDKFIGEENKGMLILRNAGHYLAAYTLNNTQPVRCTLVGDQPLFYMDIEMDLEEDLDAFEESVSALEADIEALRRKVMDYEDRMEPSVTEDMFDDFLDNARDISVAGSCKLESLSPVLNRIRQSRFGAVLLDFALEENIAIVLCAQADRVFYDRAQAKITINPDLNEEDAILLIAQELRRVWQHKNGAALHPLTFHPDHAVLVNRAQHADLCVAMIRIAWEMQLAGDKKPWARLESSSLSDLARIFAREAFLDFRSLNNGQAAAALFESWFLTERCRRQDRQLIQLMLADYQGYVFENEQASRFVTADLISALGSVPFGKNYLAPFAGIILSDPVFTEIRDRSNANFLWFIKFEKSFRDAEQELHSTLDGADSGSMSRSEEKEREKPAEIIKLARYRAAVKKDEKHDPEGQGAQIIRFAPTNTGRI